MKVIGVTGAIGSGKSTVATILRDLGAVVINADHIARDVVRPGTEAWEKITASFGGQLLLDNGAIDRKALGRIVFGNETALERLNAIVHPEVITVIQERIERLRRQSPPPKAIVLDVPLLFEVGLNECCDISIVVTAPLEQRRERLKKLGLSDSEIEQRVQAQRDKDSLQTKADIIIENDGTFEDLQKHVRGIWSRVN